MLGAVLLALGSAPAAQQDAPSDAPSEAQRALEADAGPAAPGWEVELQLYLFGTPEDEPYPFLMAPADHGALHVELRYQYEDLETASIWAGWNLSFGDALALDLTPMLGVVVGRTDGLALALEHDLTWRGFEWYGESEHVWTPGGEDDFLYTWQELTWAPSETVRFGLMAQRTQAFEQELAVDRGLLLGLSFEQVSVDLYAMNLDRDDTYGGVGVTFAF